MPKINVELTGLEMSNKKDKLVLAYIQARRRNAKQNFYGVLISLSILAYICILLYEGEIFSSYLFRYIFDPAEGVLIFNTGIFIEHTLLLGALLFTIEVIFSLVRSKPGSILKPNFLDKWLTEEFYKVYSLEYGEKIPSSHFYDNDVRERLHSLGIKVPYIEKFISYTIVPLYLNVLILGSILGNYIGEVLFQGSGVAIFRLIGFTGVNGLIITYIVYEFVTNMPSKITRQLLFNFEITVLILLLLLVFSIVLSGGL